MNGDVVSRTLPYSKHKIFALNYSAVQTKAVSDLSLPGFWSICHYARCIYVNAIAEECSGWGKKREERKAFWMNFACERVLRKYWRMLMREAHCRMFPKHKETCALNIEESSGTVYLPAASLRLQISTNNLTCHFMVWYFCGTWKPQTPNTWDTHRTI